MSGISLKKGPRSLHSYVPFYFATHPPMLFVQYKKDIQDEIVILEIDRSILKDQGVLFTDGNATLQQLSKSGSEKVYITPATITHPSCRRFYYPDGPYGSNTNTSNFYAGITFLEKLDWNAISGRSYVWGEKKRMRQAELLIPDILPLGRIQGISVNTENLAQAINALVAKCGLKGRIPPAISKPDLFIQ